MPTRTADVDLIFSWLVAAPRHLTLERQLNKSVLIGWSIPEPPGCHQIESYHVYVDGVLKVTVKANERTRALVEGVDSNRVRFKTNLFLHFYLKTYFYAINKMFSHKITNSHTELACAVSPKIDVHHEMPLVQ